jgi:hypothetical protein
MSVPSLMKLGSAKQLPALSIVSLANTANGRLAQNPAVWVRNAGVVSLRWLHRTVELLARPGTKNGIATPSFAPKTALPLHGLCGRDAPRPVVLGLALASDLSSPLPPTAV